MDLPDEDYSKPKFGFRIYENFRNIVKKSKSNYDLSEAVCPTYEDVEVTSSHALSSLDSSMTTDSLNVIKSNDGNATDDSGIDSIDQNGNNSSPEPLLLRSFKTENEKSGTKTKKSSIETPIYSSVLKKKSNPARDFALTVLENDKKSVIKKVEQAGQDTAEGADKDSDLNEISQLLNSTNALLTRNSHLRASLTIKVQRSNSKKTTKTTFVLPKNVVQETVEVCSSSSASPGSSTASSDKCDTSEEESMPSLEPPVNPFSRHNPTRRPMEVRRSVRLAPKTVATLASKFDNLLSSGEASKKQSKDNVKLGKKDIAKIIGTLEKLDEDAKKESLVLQKNKTTIKKEDIDSMMKSKKSALEQVELPSNSTPEMEVENEVEIEATNTTDKYLQTLQKIAKDNAVTGEFKTSLPHPPHTVCDPPIQHTNNEQKEEVHKTTIEIGTEEKEDLIVTATPAIVTEDQLDSISFYDDVGTLKPSYLGLGGGDLYESIAGSILNLAKRNSSMEDMYSSVLYASKNEGESIDNVHHHNIPSRQSRGSMRSSSIYSEAGHKSVTSDEWIDLEEEEEEIEEDTDTETEHGSPTKNANFFTRAANARNSHRQSTRKRWQNRSRRNWAQMASSANNNAMQKDESSTNDEELYESIYEVIQPRNIESESDFDEIMEDNGDLEKTPLNKLAEAANKKMRKLRRNWSLKKNDISKSWSRIRKYSTPVIRPTFPVTVSHSNTLKRKPSRKGQTVLPDPKAVVRHHGGPIVDGTNNDTTFYITLTIEQDDDDDDPLERLDATTSDKKKKGWRSKRRVGGGSTSTSASSTAGASSSNLEPDSRSVTISMSGSSVISGNTSKSSPDSSLLTEHLNKSLCKPPRKLSQLSRPTEAPPAPPPRRHSSKPINFLLGSRLSENELLDSPLCATSEAAVQETYMSSFFQTEPLYQQFYTNQILNIETSSTEEMYECVGHPDLDHDQDSLESDPDVPKEVKKRPSAMDLTSTSNGRRSMWSELPEVLDSGILDNITCEAKKLHEAMFEVITSEASYLKSLNILMKHFAQSPKLSGIGSESVISKWDHKRLFGDVINVRQCSERFLEDLEKKWQNSVLLDGLCEVVRDHARDHFHIYVKYCTNQVDQGKLLNELSENPRFVDSLKELEWSPVCQSLKMQSFLMLPMQRITRLPLLISAIFSRLDENSAEFEPCQESLNIINKLVTECNDSALIEGRRKEMLLLEQQLKFRGDVKLFPLCSASRWLVKRGDATRIYWKENAEAKLTFGRKVSKQMYNFLLFNDILVIAKKKSDGTFQVVDYCPRNLVQMSELLEEEGSSGNQPLPRLPYGMSHAKNLDLKQVVLFTLLQNHEHKTIEWLLTFPTEAEKSQWIQLVTPDTKTENPGEKIYQDWDCPLVEAVASIQPEASNEIPLQKGEKANVLRKLSDSGWYYIEKLGDGQKGWVPMSATREIESNHIRARNFKQRHAFLKLLTTSMDYIESNDLLNNNQMTMMTNQRRSYCED